MPGTSFVIQGHSGFEPLQDGVCKVAHGINDKHCCFLQAPILFVSMQCCTLHSLFGLEILIYVVRYLYLTALVTIDSM